MKNYYLWVFVTVMLLGAETLTSAEIIPVWNKTVEGEVQDMDFLKGQNEVLMLVGGVSDGQIQRRNPDNGELISFKPLGLSEKISRLALTPDSSKFVLINGSSGTLRNLDENYTIDRTFFIQRPKDSILAYFTQISIDPIRPNAYVTVWAWDLKKNNYAPYNQVIAYNYETGEHIKDLTPYGEYDYTAIAVSPDGKYLATLNDNKTYLKVWDLQSMEQIINEPLFDPNSNDWCEAQDIYFSKINPDLIYYSGNFTKKLNSKDIYPPSVYTFSMKTKAKDLLLPDEIYGGFDMIFFDNETRIFNSSNGYIDVINLPNNKLEYFGDPDSVYTTIVIYNSINNYFIGAGNNKLSKFTYDGITQINQGYEQEITISPNPTGSFVKISLNCTEPQINYQINDSSGLLLLQNTVPNQGNNLQIDFSPYPVGVYFLTLNCNNQPKTYKIIKEG